MCRIGGLIDLAHAPLANEGGDVIVAESGADGKGHRLFRLVWGSFYSLGMKWVQRLHRNACTTRTFALCGASAAP